jgi:hypothetical protein
MNRVTTTILMLVLMLLSCGDKERIVEVPVEVPGGCAPSPPRGIMVTNHTGYVTICWNSNLNETVSGYKVYYGYYNDYDEIEFEEESPLADIIAPADEPEWYCVDDTETQNLQWLYAVRAYNKYGLSDYSYVAQGTPRPEGSTRLFEHIGFPEYCGFDFNLPDTIGKPLSAAGTDIYFSIESGINELITNPAREVDIQDYGFVGDWDIFDAFDLITYAPDSGWAPSGRVEAISGHMYMLRIDRDAGSGLYHYAKIYITEIGPDYVRYRWAYQEDIGNPDLAPPRPDGQESHAMMILHPDAAPAAQRGGFHRGSETGSTIPPIVQRG